MIKQHVPAGLVLGLTIICLGLTACGSSDEGIVPTAAAPAMQKLVAQLDSLGFYKYAAAGKAQQLEADAARTGSLFDNGTNRVYLSDEKAIAEGGVRHFFTTIDPFMRLQGVRIDEIRDDYANGSYSLLVNGRTYPIYSADEASQTAPADFRHLIVRRAYSVVNDLLQRAGSPERIYQLSGGTGGFAVFLTPQMYTLVKESPLIPDSNKPVDLQ